MLKAYLAIEMSLNNAETHGKLQSCHTLRGNMQIAAETTQTYDLYKFDTTQLYLNFLLITQHEVKRQKRSNDRTENDKCTNVTNCRSRVG